MPWTHGMFLLSAAISVIGFFLLAWDGPFPAVGLLVIAGLFQVVVATYWRGSADEIAARLDAQVLRQPKPSPEQTALVARRAAGLLVLVAAASIGLEFAMR